MHGVSSPPHLLAVESHSATWLQVRINDDQDNHVFDGHHGSDIILIMIIIQQHGFRCELMLFYDHHSDQDIIIFVMVIMAMIIITCDQHHQNCRRHHHLYLYLPVCLEPTGRFASGECSQVQALLQTGQQTNLVTMMMIVMMMMRRSRVKDDDGHISKLLWH